MSHIELACSECHECFHADMHRLSCDVCRSPLDVAYRDPGRHVAQVEGLRMPVPFHADRPVLTLGEGGTPIVPLPEVGDAVGMSNVFGKLEFMNPTGSFKDRGTATMLSMALEFGTEVVVEDSSGNAGASVAAYGARAGMSTHIFAPQTAPEAKMSQIRVYGAAAHQVAGPREASTEAALEHRRLHGAVYASHNLSPYFIEGTKTFAYEVAAQMNPTPDHIVVPVGNGSLLLGAWKGFQELLSALMIERVPRLHAVQAKAVMPIAAEYGGQNWRTGRTTIAGGISVGEPPRKSQVLKALRASGGGAVAVDDDDIVRWQGLLATREGVFMEPTSAAAFAGLERLARAGHIRSDEVVIVPITGFGLKDALPPST